MVVKTTYSIQCFYLDNEKAKEDLVSCMFPFTGSVTEVPDFHINWKWYGTFMNVLECQGISFSFYPIFVFVCS